MLNCRGHKDVINCTYATYDEKDCLENTNIWLMYCMMYLCKEVDLEACRLVGFRLAVIQVVPHRQHKLKEDRMQQAEL